MKQRLYGDSNQKDLLLLPGWGNRIDDSNMGWLVDLLVTAGFRVHAFEFPCNITDFHRECLQPIKDYQNTLGEHVILSHSMGGLVSAYLDAQRKTVYLSPWWGIFGEKVRRTLLSVFCSFKFSTPVFPIDFIKDEVGDLATDTYWALLPKKVSPAFVREIVKAQRAMPALQQDHIVFCTLKDTIVNLKAVGERTQNVFLYDGFHELFSSSTRDSYKDELLSALTI
jgi:hypothetical protein